MAQEKERVWYHFLLKGYDCPGHPDSYTSSYCIAEPLNSTPAAVQRFRIMVDDNGDYCVSIPEYLGGEVVDAAAYDSLCEQNQRLMKTLRMTHAEWQES